MPAAVQGAAKRRERKERPAPTAKQAAMRRILAMADRVHMATVKCHAAVHRDPARPAFRVHAPVLPARMQQAKRVPIAALAGRQALQGRHVGAMAPSRKRLQEKILRSFSRM